MAEVTGTIIESVGATTGCTENGDFVKLTMGVGGLEPKLFFVPFGEMQRLIAACFAGYASAYAEKLKVLGTQQAVIEQEASFSIRPSGYQVARGADLDGGQHLLLRIQSGGAPVVDVSFTADEGAQLAADIGVELAKGPAEAPVRN